MINENGGKLEKQTRRKKIVDGRRKKKKIQKSEKKSKKQPENKVPGNMSRTKYKTREVSKSR